MIFNQWAASHASNLPTPARLACEAIWNALVKRGTSTIETSDLLSDLDEDEDYG